jgi:hypothetical protein
VPGNFIYFESHEALREYLTTVDGDADVVKLVRPSSSRGE